MVYLQTTSLASTASTISKLYSTAIGMSDTLSKVYLQTASVASVASTVSKLYSQAIGQSDAISDVYVRQASQYTKVYSLVAEGGLNASAISDIASAVWAQHWDKTFKM